MARWRRFTTAKDVLLCCCCCCPIQVQLAPGAHAQLRAPGQDSENAHFVVHVWRAFKDRRHSSPDFDHVTAAFEENSPRGRFLQAEYGSPDLLYNSLIAWACIWFSNLQSPDHTVHSQPNRTCSTTDCGIVDNEDVKAAVLVSASACQGWESVSFM